MRPGGYASIDEAAKMGNGYALAMMIKRATGANKLPLAVQSASTGDALGMFGMFLCHFHGYGVPKNVDLSFEHLQNAADAGCVNAVLKMADLTSDLRERIALRSQIIRYGEPRGMPADVRSALLGLRMFPGAEEAVFVAGKSMRGLLMGKTSMLGNVRCMASEVRDCARAIRLFLFWSSSTREAVMAWTLCARRLGVIKDVRGMISRMVWETRKLGLYENKDTGLIGRPLLKRKEEEI